MLNLLLTLVLLGIALFAYMETLALLFPNLPLRQRWKVALNTNLIFIALYWAYRIG